MHEAILNRAPTSALRLNPNLPLKLEEIIIRALEKDRQIRYQTASGLGAELKRLRRDIESGRATATSERPPDMLTSRRRSLYTLMGATLGGMLVLGGTVLYYHFTAPLPRPHIERIIQITHTGHQKNSSG